MAMGRPVGTPDTDSETWPWERVRYSVTSEPFEVTPAVITVDYIDGTILASIDAPNHGYRLIDIEGSSVGANPVMDATCRFGGGYKVGLITLDFSDTLDIVQTQINAAPLERSSYLLPDALPFTLSFEPQPDTPMTYADHIYAQHEQYITETSDDYCHQILTDGFMAPD